MYTVTWHNNQQIKVQIRARERKLLLIFSNQNTVKTNLKTLAYLLYIQIN